MIYAYCPNCKSVNEARIIPESFFTVEGIGCRKCDKRIKGKLLKKTCEVCQSVLYVYKNHVELELPCKAIHEQEQSAARIEEEKREKENRLRFSMRAISCQHCQGVVLRLKYGKYERCPNCGNEPSEEYIKKKWEDITNQKPQIIRWIDPANEKLIHVVQCTESIPPYSLLVVEPGYYVQYSSDGTKWKTLKNDRYALFKDERTEEEKIMVANENEALSLGLATRIIFFNEAVCRNVFRISICIGNGRWKVTIPVTLHLQISSDNVNRFMGRGWNWTDDQGLTESVESLVQGAAANRIECFILAESENDDTVQGLANENSVRLWIDEVFRRNRQHITSEVQQDFCDTYGIAMPDLIEFGRVDITDLHQTRAVECTHCKHINHVLADVHSRRETFRCESCKAEIKWCSTCGQYVTDRRITHVCDIGRHRIW